MNKRQLAKLGITEETEEQRAAGRQVIKNEIVDEMFDFGWKPTVASRILRLRPFRRMKIGLADTKCGAKHYFTWRSIALAKESKYNVMRFQTCMTEKIF